MSDTTVNSSHLVYESINDDYEWIQYNKQLRIIHSIKDDMYQVQSIINACNSHKQATRWVNSENRIEIYDEIAKVQNCTQDQIIQNRRNLAPGLKGYYVHRLLINHVAMWASPIYAVHIFKLLDEIASNDRKELLNQIESQNQIIAEQRPRLVPENKEKSYKYLIWKEELPNDPDMILLHLVKRNKNNFRQVSKHYNNINEKWFYRENLPIAMTPNEDIKALVKQSFPGSEYDINGSTIMTYKVHLDKLYNIITEYFDKFQI
ncbi:hypothetical protein M9Y10_016185 [Tritrichomonas musculus]|uniref:KilA-N domain-containing protein n=1 Tax=Tritrichomonas musculus TaxID=1915356 RepID=A0ABR2I5J2_9EUKA